MAFAVACKGDPLAGLLKNLLAAAPSFTSALGRSSGAVARCLFSTQLGNPFRVQVVAWWVSKQDEDAMQVKVQMPGLAAEHVKVSTDHKGLFIKGVGVQDPDDDDQEPEQYSCRIVFSADAFRVNQGQAEMKEGVLKVTVPRVKKDLGDNTEIKVHKG